MLKLYRCIVGRIQLRATNAISTLPEVCHVVSEQVYLRLFMLLGASLLVTSCAMVGPDFQKPEADVTEAWSEVDEPEISTESIDYREW